MCKLVARINGYNIIDWYANLSINVSYRNKYLLLLLLLLHRVQLA